MLEANMLAKRNKIILVLFTTILLGITSMSVFAASDIKMTLGDAEAGVKLHQKHCIKCHSDSVYTGKLKKVRSYEALSGRVKVCDQQIGTNFTRTQLQDVTEYLNDRYYDFQL